MTIEAIFFKISNLLVEWSGQLIFLGLTQNILTKLQAHWYKRWTILSSDCNQKPIHLNFKVMMSAQQTQYESTVSFMI
jgi:hypothetical protein